MREGLPRLRGPVQEDGRLAQTFVSSPRNPDAASELPIITFASAADWEAWLAAAPRESKGLWLKLAKKTSRAASVSQQDAIDVALCHGWIDGQLARFDDEYWLVRFTPRRDKSKWSEINRNRAWKLIDEGRMKPPGLKEIERAKADGRWDAAYAPQSKATPCLRICRPRWMRRPTQTHVRGIGQRQSLRDPSSRPRRQKAGDSGAAYREICSDARSRGHYLSPQSQD